MDAAQTTYFASEGLLSELLAQARTFRNSHEYMQRLDFIVRMGNMAPYNAMLLQVQKPGIQFAASRRDWARKFDRRVINGARPLLIMWPFAPVLPVYDLEDTEGPPLPPALTAYFRATGPVTTIELEGFRFRLSKKHIQIVERPLPADHAGQVARRAGADRCEERPHHVDVQKRPLDAQVGSSSYEILMNSGHDPNVKFSTLVHELAHVMLGHLGPDKALAIRSRAIPPLSVREVEEESVSHLVCARRGVDSFAHVYLADHLERMGDCSMLDLYGICRVAGQIETLLGIAPANRFTDDGGAPLEEQAPYPAWGPGSSVAADAELRRSVALMLERTGWLVQRVDDLKFVSAEDAVGVAYEERPTQLCPSGFILVVAGQVAGVIEVSTAHAPEAAVRTCGQRWDDERLEGLPVRCRRLPFVYAVGSRSTCFLDARLLEAMPRAVSAVHRPGDLLACLEASDTGRILGVGA